MNLSTLLLLATLIIFNHAIAFEGCTDEMIYVGVDYDSRPFLTITQKSSFKKIYPEFDEEKPHKKWKYKDVDPLGFFSSSENRTRRRNKFLFEYSPDLIRKKSEGITAAQRGFKDLLNAQIQGVIISLDKQNIKIVSPYTEDYENNFPACNFLEKLATLGLQWAQAGGHNLYIYNGSIYLGSYKSGWASIANRNIDKPSLKLRAIPQVEEKVVKEPIDTAI